MLPQDSLDSPGEYSVDKVHWVRRGILHFLNPELPLKESVSYLFPMDKFHLLLDWAITEQEDFLP